jgi:hypothetical protein
MTIIHRSLEEEALAPKEGALPKTTVLFSMSLLKQNNLDVIVACGWLCANVPICLLGGHKSWHNRAASVLGNKPFLAHLLFLGT